MSDDAVDEAGALPDDRGLEPVTGASPPAVRGPSPRVTAAIIATGASVLLAYCVVPIVGVSAIAAVASGLLSIAAAVLVSRWAVAPLRSIDPTDPRADRARRGLRLAMWWFAVTAVATAAFGTWLAVSVGGCSSSSGLYCVAFIIVFYGVSWLVVAASALVGVVLLLTAHHRAVAVLRSDLDEPGRRALHTRHRRELIGVGAAGTVALVAVLGLVVVPALQPPPAFPILSEQPNPEFHGTLAYYSFPDHERCLVVVAASGGPRKELFCGDAEYYGSLTWNDDGTLLIDDYPDHHPHQVDPRTGAVSTGPEMPIDYSRFESMTRAFPWSRTSAAPDGTVAEIAGQDGVARIDVRQPDGAIHTLVSVPGPRDYRFTGVAWSADGSWLAVSDITGRLLVVFADGTGMSVLDTDNHAGDELATTSADIPLG